MASPNTTRYEQPFKRLEDTTRTTTPTHSPTGATRQRPTSYGYSYYSAFYAAEIRPVLGVVKSNPEGVTLSLTATCRSVKTLENRIRQAWRYLIDFDDPQGEYLALKRSTKLTYGVDCISITHRAPHRRRYTTPEQAGWQDRLIAFLEQESGRFERRSINFSPAEIGFIRQVLGPMQDRLVYEINKDGLTVEFRA